MPVVVVVVVLGREMTGTTSRRCLPTFLSAYLAFWETVAVIEGRFFLLCSFSCFVDRIRFHTGPYTSYYYLIYLASFHRYSLSARITQLKKTAISYSLDVMSFLSGPVK